MSPVVVLAPDIARVVVSADERQEAVDVAYRLTMSPHEWSWTQREQEAMARYVLWSAQRMAGICQLTNGDLG